MLPGALPLRYARARLPWVGSWLRDIHCSCKTPHTHYSFPPWGPTKDGSYWDLRARPLVWSNVRWCCACPEPRHLQNEINTSWSSTCRLHHCETQTASKHPRHKQVQQCARLESMQKRDEMWSDRWAFKHVGFFFWVIFDVGVFYFEKMSFLICFDMCLVNFDIHSQYLLRFRQYLVKIHEYQSNLVWGTPV